MSARPRITTAAESAPVGIVGDIFPEIAMALHRDATGLKSFSRHFEICRFCYERCGRVKLPSCFRASIPSS